MMTIMAVITVQHEISTPKIRINPHPPYYIIYININIYHRTGIKYYSDDGKLRVINFTENKNKLI